MRILYEFEDIVNKHYSSGNPLRKDTNFVIEDLSKRYDVHKKTVQAWKRNDRVPVKYMQLPNWE